jgi:hypothetical protein
MRQAQLYPTTTISNSMYLSKLGQLEEVRPVAVTAQALCCLGVAQATHRHAQEPLYTTLQAPHTYTGGYPSTQQQQHQPSCRIDSAAAARKLVCSSNAHSKYSHHSSARVFLHHQVTSTLPLFTSCKQQYCPNPQPTPNSHSDSMHHCTWHWAKQLATHHLPYSSACQLHSQCKASLLSRAQKREENLPSFAKQKHVAQW